MLLCLCQHKWNSSHKRRSNGSHGQKTNKHTHTHTHTGTSGDSAASWELLGLAKNTRKRRAKHKCHIAVMAINKKKLQTLKKGQHFIHIVRSVCVCVCPVFQWTTTRSAKNLRTTTGCVGGLLRRCQTPDLSHAKFGSEKTGDGLRSNSCVA